MHATLPLLARTDFPALRRGRLDTLQVNLGYRCNQRCLHCHVGAGPHRSESMSAATVDLVLGHLRSGRFTLFLIVMSGFFIERCRDEAFASHQFQVSGTKVPVEGHLSSIEYRLPREAAKRSTLEIIRNDTAGISAIGGCRPTPARAGG